MNQPPADSENGILASIPGQYVAEAIQLLPPVDTAEDRDYTVEIDAGHVGRVRIYARRQLARHGKHAHWFWLVNRAEAI
ncbi:MAG: hypothetical protein EPN46_03920 [Candidimonas sp.]|nr:MAG: hypothetical protein EPN77_09425 [Candidimonas sp.]TAM26803.1 MAG: hypothetical protein EPN62_01025 [Candidimonas sp.]TAM79274.1 MAG: hypothetical protein EPN46_03920 [Candidimonas sp.]